MLFSKKKEYKKCFCRKLSFIVGLLFAAFFINFVKVSDVNAWDLTDPFFSSSNTFTLYRSYMESDDGAPFIVNDEQVNLFSTSDWLVSPTDSAIQTKTLFGFTNAGYVFNGDDKTKLYHSAQAVFYFTAYNSSYIDFNNVPISAKYVLTDDGNGNLSQYVSCSLSYVQSSSAPYYVSVSINCPQVTYRGSGYHYKWVDLIVGSASGNDFNSDYFYKYRNGGGLKVSVTIGQYIVSSTDNASELALEQITVQNQTIINQNQQMIDDSEEYYNRTYDALDNISNQSTSDIPNSESAQTTSIIGTISSFISAIQNVQATNCQLTLPFPSFVGGSTTVDVCTAKEKAPTIVTIGSSMLLIGTFIPLAFVVLKMIFNEIRSWTNG